MDAPEQPNLCPSTSQIAGAQAALKSGSWRQRILDRLRAAPAALWEVATEYQVPDHTISGRFTELASDGYIERTGDRRKHPVSECPADVWRVRGAAAVPEPKWAELLGYPLTLRINGEMYDRQELLNSEGYPGIPYARRADTGGVRLNVRVQLIECPSCGKPLFLLEDRDKAQPGKQARCGNAHCGRVYRTTTVQESGRASIIALVMEKF